MIRNFVAGTLWGVVVAGVGLAVVSEVAPLPKIPAGMATGAVKGGEGAAVPAQAAKPQVGADPVVPKADVAAADIAVAPAAPAEVGLAQPELPANPPVKPLPFETAAAEPAPVATTEMAAPAALPAPALPADSPSDDQLALGDAQDAPAAIAAPPAVGDAPSTLKAPQAGAAQPVQPATEDPALAVGQPADAPAVDQADARPGAADAPPPVPEVMLDPAPEIIANPAPATIAPVDPVVDPAPVLEAVPEAVSEAVPEAVPEAVADAPAIAGQAPIPDIAVLQPVAPPEPAPSLIAKDQPSTFAPDSGVTSAAVGITTGRLPRIGDAPAETTDAAPVELPPIQQFAQKFDNPSAKPLFAILLRDTGGADVDRATLAALPFPVSFVIDPLAPNAAEAAAIYRAAGQEVIMLASGIPAGAQASDLEQTFQSLAAALPQAVAVMDIFDGGFQNDRPLATLVVPIVKTQGRGLITFNGGLNAADQVARREDVPAATIFRQLDAAGEDLPLIRRYLDRAAFKAAQDGRVVVLGDTRPETIAALMEWTIEGRASSVTLAPVTAVLSVD